VVSLRYLSREDAFAAGAGDWRAALADVRAAVALFAQDKAGMVAECVLPMGADPREKAYGLPAFVAGDYDAAGLKWTVHRATLQRDLPSIVSATFINRLRDGRPVGVVESAFLTRMRTAAVSALAIQTLLARPPETAALLGAGAQAATHLDMLHALFPSVRRVQVWNRDPARRDAMLAGVSRRTGAVLSAADRLDLALDGAEAVLCCTSSREPLLDASAVRPGRLIVQVGYHEVAFDAIEATDYVAVDLWGDFAITSAKSLFQMYRAGQFTPDRVAANLVGLVVEGRRPPAGASTYFSSFGLNLFDIAIAARLLKCAEKAGIGTVLPFI
jgi:ornithine cyclodeaminase